MDIADLDCGGCRRSADYTSEMGCSRTRLSWRAAITLVVCRSTSSPNEIPLKKSWICLLRSNQSSCVRQRWPFCQLACPCQRVVSIFFLLVLCFVFFVFFF